MLIVYGGNKVTSRDVRGPRGGYDMKPGKHFMRREEERGGTETAQAHFGVEAQRERQRETHTRRTKTGNMPCARSVPRKKLHKDSRYAVAEAGRNFEILHFLILDKNTDLFGALPEHIAPLPCRHPSSSAPLPPLKGPV